MKNNVWLFNLTKICYSFRRRTQYCECKESNFDMRKRKQCSLFHFYVSWYFDFWKTCHCYVENKSVETKRPKKYRINDKDHLKSTKYEPKHHLRLWRSFAQCYAKADIYSTISHFLHKCSEVLRGSYRPPEWIHKYRQKFAIILFIVRLSFHLMQEFLYNSIHITILSSDTVIGDLWKVLVKLRHEILFRQNFRMCSHDDWTTCFFINWAWYVTRYTAISIG